MRQATFNATITDTTPGLITDLLARASDDPTATDTKPDQVPAISSDTFSVSSRTGI